MSSFRERSGPQLPSWLPIERLVVLLTPAFGAAAAWLVAWVGTHFPGLPAISTTAVVALEVSGFTGAVAAVLKWLHGRQKFVRFETGVDTLTDKIVAAVKANAALDRPIRDIEQMLQLHASAIIDAVSKGVGLPASAEEIAQEVVRKLLGQTTLSSGVMAGSGVAPSSAEAPAPMPEATAVQAGPGIGHAQ